jgi:hypothetical protein
MPSSSVLQEPTLVPHGGAKGLLNMVQQVQNDMVKQVTGAFHLAPQDVLLHFTHMIPMKHFIEKLTYTSVLCLHRLPWASVAASSSWSFL